jgi:hypothetical protein
MGAVEKLTLVKIILFDLGKTPNNNRRPRWGTVKMVTKYLLKVPVSPLCLDFN